jgi:hypothetical protein
MMQPLLMLKQTLEASYDPGALLLDGANVKFTSADQFLTHRGSKTGTGAFSIELGDEGRRSQTHYERGEQTLGVTRHEIDLGTTKFSLTPTMRSSEVEAALPQWMREVGRILSAGRPSARWEVVRERCFLRARLRLDPDAGISNFQIGGILNFGEVVNCAIHLPGLRGSPERTYPITAVESKFPGTFDRYTASVINQWQSQGETAKLRYLTNDLRHLGLTWKVATIQRDETQVELRVGRLPAPRRGGAKDLVNIADVGFGVSQTLPVLVALLIAEPGQLVYLEQPEIHLHPRAQAALARPLLAAAARGVRVVVETHSSLLLLGIQTLVAEGADADLVKLHWFTRDADTGYTHITSSDLDELGRFEMDWPEDFAEISMTAEGRYLDAVEQRQLAGAD